MDRATMRKRGWSIQSDQTSHSGREKENGDGDELDDHEKEALLNSFPVDDMHAEEHHTVSDHPPAHKRRKTEDPVLEGQTHREEATFPNKEEMVNEAKKKLSKWAARLFDPDRPRGLVQAPQTIPLNDEFLTAFGKRERELDDKLGRKLEIEHEIVDEDDFSDEVDDMDNSSSDAKNVPVEGRKVSL